MALSVMECYKINQAESSHFVVAVSFAEFNFHSTVFNNTRNKKSTQVSAVLKEAGRRFPVRCNFDNTCKAMHDT